MSEVNDSLTKVMEQLEKGFNPEPPEEKALPEQSGHLIEANDPNYPKKDSFIGKLGKNKVAQGVAGVVVAGGAMLATASHAEAKTPPQQEQTPLSSTIQKSELNSVEPLITTIETTGVIGNTNTIDSSVWNVPQSEPVTVKTMSVEAGGDYLFANPAFEVKWNSIDGLTPAERVAKGMVASQYYGGKVSSGLIETIEGKEYPVQYFEKERMELQPTGEVTSGLLSRDLIRAGADIRVAGDPESDPLTYKDMQKFSTVFESENRAPDLTDQPVTYEFKNGQFVKNGYDGRIGTFTNSYYFPETGHNVPDQFLGSFAPSEQGLVDLDKAANELVKVAGYPISEPVIKDIMIGNQKTTVMIQAFERRVLTDNPKNNKENQVEWGNIGSAFYDYTYKDVGKVATKTPTPIAEATATPTEVVNSEGQLTLEVQYKAGTAKFFTQPHGAIIKDNNKDNIVASLNAFYDIDGYNGNVDFKMISLPIGALDGPGGDRFYTNGAKIYSESSNTSTQETFKWYDTEPQEVTENGVKTYKIYVAEAGNEGNNDLLVRKQNTPDQDRINYAVGAGIFMRISHVNTPSEFGTLLHDHPELFPLIGYVDGAINGNALPLKLLPPTP